MENNSNVAEEENENYNIEEENEEENEMFGDDYEMDNEEFYFSDEEVDIGISPIHKIDLDNTIHNCIKQT